MTTTRTQSAQSAKTSAKTPPARTPVLLLRDYWDPDGQRHGKGATIEVDVTTAKQLILARKAERADPFPGEASR